MRRLTRNLATRLRAGFLLGRRMGKVDVHVFGGLLLLGIGAARIDLEGALLLVGALVLMLGVMGARNGR